MSALEELQELADQLLKQAQGLPPGTERNNALKDVGKLRRRVDALKRQLDQDHPAAISRFK